MKKRVASIAVVLSIIMLGILYIDSTNTASASKPSPFWDVFVTNDVLDVNILNTPLEVTNPPSDPLDIEGDVTIIDGSVTLNPGAEVTVKTATKTQLLIDAEKIPAWSGSGDFPKITGSINVDGYKTVHIHTDGVDGVNIQMEAVFTIEAGSGAIDFYAPAIDIAPPGSMHHTYEVTASHLILKFYNRVTSESGRITVVAYAQSK